MTMNRFWLFLLLWLPAVSIGQSASKLYAEAETYESKGNVCAAAQGYLWVWEKNNKYKDARARVLDCYLRCHTQYYQESQALRAKGQLQLAINALLPIVGNNSMLEQRKLPPQVPEGCAAYMAGLEQQLASHYLTRIAALEYGGQFRRAYYIARDSVPQTYRRQGLTDTLAQLAHSTVALLPFYANTDNEAAAGYPFMLLKQQWKTPELTTTLDAETAEMAFQKLGDKPHQRTPSPEAARSYALRVGQELQADYVVFGVVTAFGVDEVKDCKDKTVYARRDYTEEDGTQTYIYDDPVDVEKCESVLTHSTSLDLYVLEVATGKVESITIAEKATSAIEYLTLPADGNTDLALRSRNKPGYEPDGSYLEKTQVHHPDGQEMDEELYRKLMPTLHDKVGVLLYRVTVQ